MPLQVVIAKAGSSAKCQSGNKVPGENLTRTAGAGIPFSLSKSAKPFLWLHVQSCQKVKHLGILTWVKSNLFTLGSFTWLQFNLKSLNFVCLVQERCCWSVCLKQCTFHFLINYKNTDKLDGYFFEQLFLMLIILSYILFQGMKLDIFQFDFRLFSELGPMSSFQ